MIQAVTETMSEEIWACTTPVCQNIRKVLNPLFLMIFVASLEQAGDSPQKATQFKEAHVENKDF